MAMNDLYSESLYIKALLININEFCYMPQLTINSYLTVTLWSSDNLLMVLGLLVIYTLLMMLGLPYP